MTKVELFEIIRKEYFIQGKSIRRIARERAVHRRMVRKAIEDAVPPARVKAGRKCSVLIPAIKIIIDKIIINDQKQVRPRLRLQRL